MRATSDNVGSDKNFYIQYDLDKNEDYVLSTGSKGDGQKGKYRIHILGNHDKFPAPYGGVWEQHERYSNRSKLNVVRRFYTADGVALLYKSLDQKTFEIIKEIKKTKGWSVENVWDIFSDILGGALALAKLDPEIELLIAVGTFIFNKIATNLPALKKQKEYIDDYRTGLFDASNATGDVVDNVYTIVFKNGVTIENYEGTHTPWWGYLPPVVFVGAIGGGPDVLIKLKTNEVNFYPTYTSWIEGVELQRGDVTIF
ncbi:hypothetical protein [Haploplasma axanthum]|uniref:hypothetical protein n=1 Tax=Haploplasma axanthum TaxID=29552 RepID=UPI000410BA55|nr:hypothetical protein [Haploplasma axanthum]